VNMRLLGAAMLAAALGTGALLVAGIPASATTLTHHRAVHTLKSEDTVQIKYIASVDPSPAMSTASHGRGAPSEDVFSRNAEDCNHSLCIGQ
jgi:hypothetical protein